MLNKKPRYIMPAFSVALTYEVLDEYYHDHFKFLLTEKIQRAMLNDILQYRRTFIVAEPGHGKTRLMQELYNTFRENNENCVFLELRNKVTSESISDWLNRQKGVDDADVILLDGLDEVPLSYVSETVVTLVEYIESTKKAVYVSCRYHYFSRFKQHFSRLNDVRYLLINSLGKNEATDFLQSCGVDERAITALFSAMSVVDGAKVLRSPRYLNMIAKIISEGRAAPGAINRMKLFEEFVAGALVVEDKKHHRQLAEYKKRLLEFLALTMEIAQLNQIASDDFVTFIDRLNSSSKDIVCNNQIDEIYDYSLINRDLDGIIRFNDREIQEYLAAKCIARMANPQRKIFSLAVEANMREIIPSWRNTLSFLIDEYPEVARYIVDLNPNRSPFDSSMGLLVTSSTGGKMTTSDMAYIFDYVHNESRERQKFIQRELSLQLAGYAQKRQINDVLKDFLKLPDAVGSELIYNVNLINLVANFVKVRKINDEKKQELSDKIMQISLHGLDDTIKINALNALIIMAIKEDDLKTLRPLLESSSQVVRSLEDLVYATAPSSDFAIDVYVKSLKRDNYTTAYRGMQDITLPRSIGYFLHQLSLDKDLMEAMVDSDRFVDESESQLLHSIEHHWQPHWLEYLEGFLEGIMDVKHGYYVDRSEFVDRVLMLIISKNSQYCRKLIDRVGADVRKMFQYDHLIARIISLDDVDYFISKLESAGSDRYQFLNLLYSIEHTTNENQESVLRRARQLLPEDFAESDKIKAQAVARNKRHTRTAKFETYYRSIKGDKLSNEAYWAAEMIVEDNFGEYKEKIAYTAEQVKHIWSILRNEVLEKYSPKDVTISMKKIDAGQKKFTIPSAATLIEVALLFGFSTDQPEIKKYRDVLIDSFPFMQGSERNRVFAALELTQSEKYRLAQAYVGENNVANRHYSAYNFIDFVEVSGMIEAADILEEFAMSRSMDIHDRMYALNVCQKLRPSSKDFLESLRASTVLDDKDFSQAIDTLLISQYQNEDAIIRRFTYIKKIATPLDKKIADGHMHSVGDVEWEYSKKKIAEPLMALSDRGYIEKFINLLNHSFDKLSENSRYERYAAYVWEVTTSYFKNLTDMRPSELLGRIDELLDLKQKSFVSGYLFYYESIKSHHIARLGKISYAQAINRVNDYSTTDDIAIASVDELYYSVLDIIDELSRWIQQEGMGLIKKGEEVMDQRYLDLHFESMLIKKYGKDSIRFERESQAIDGTRVDFLVYYGFFGPVIIELKLSSHSDVTRVDIVKCKSYQSMKKYMKQYGAQYGIFLIHKVDTTPQCKFNDIISNNTKAYSKLPGVVVRSIG